MDEHDSLAQRFEQHRAHLRAVAYRMLGSLAEADDVVQEAWLRLARADAAEIDNLGGWLTTVVARLCLDGLRARKSHDALDGHVPDPIVSLDARDPLGQTLLADSLGLALLVVLETLSPAERLAFVLHDVFGVEFDEIARIVDRTPAAARQLASRARRRVQEGSPAPERDLARQRAVVDAFLTASRAGDFDALVAVLDPDIVLRADAGKGAARVVRGAAEVARQSLLYRKTAALEWTETPALVNGAAGLVVLVDGRLRSVLAFTIARDRIVELDILADAARLARLSGPGLSAGSAS